MQWIIVKKELQELLSPFNRLSNSKPTIPILKGVKLSFASNLITAVSADDELAIKNSIVSSKIYEDSHLLIDLKLLSEIVKRFSDGDIKLSLKGNNLHLTQKKSKYKIAIYEIDQYPNVDFELTNTVPIRLSSLKTAYDKVQHCIAKTDMRPILTGAYCDFKNGLMVATDSYRIAKSGIDNIEIDSVVITPKLMNELKNLKEEEVLINRKDNRFLIQSGSLTIVSKIIDGIYPQYQKLFSSPDDIVSSVNISVKELREALEHASLFKSDGITVIKLKTVDDTLLLSVKQSEIGSFDEELNAELNGNTVKVAFNCDYMLQALKVMECDRLTLNLDKRNIINFNDETNTQMIVPIMTHEE